MICDELFRPTQHSHARMSHYSFFVTTGQQQKEDGVLLQITLIRFELKQAGGQTGRFAQKGYSRKEERRCRNSGYVTAVIWFRCEL